MPALSRHRGPRPSIAVRASGTSTAQCAVPRQRALQPVHAAEAGDAGHADAAGQQPSPRRNRHAWHGVARPCASATICTRRIHQSGRHRRAWAGRRASTHPARHRAASRPMYRPAPKPEGYWCACAWPNGIGTPRWNPRPDARPPAALPCLVATTGASGRRRWFAGLRARPSAGPRQSGAGGGDALAWHGSGPGPTREEVASRGAWQACMSSMSKLDLY